MPPTACLCPWVAPRAWICLTGYEVADDDGAIEAADDYGVIVVGGVATVGAEQDGDDGNWLLPAVDVAVVVVENVTYERPGAG